MKNETKEWIQSVEKALKSIIFEKSIRFIKTHSLTELKNYLHSNSINKKIQNLVVIF